MDHQSRPCRGGCCCACDRCCCCCCCCCCWHLLKRYFWPPERRLQLLKRPRLLQRPRQCPQQSRSIARQQSRPPQVLPSCVLASAHFSAAAQSLGRCASASDPSRPWLAWGLPSPLLCVLLPPAGEVPLLRRRAGPVWPPAPPRHAPARAQGLACEAAAAGPASVSACAAAALSAWPGLLPPVARRAPLSQACAQQRAVQQQELEQ